MTPPGAVAVAVGYKFAVLALPDSRGGGPASPIISLPNDFAISNGLPSGTLSRWETSIGALQKDQLESCSLFLWAMKKSPTPGILDQESEELRKSVLQFYLGLLIAVPNFSSSRPALILGGNAGGGENASSFDTYARTYYTLGTASPSLTQAKLKLAHKLAIALPQQDNSSDIDRIGRAVRSFRMASESDDLSDRLHQFVRCIEAFASPQMGGSAGKFAERIARLGVGRRRNELKDLYIIRSGIEHLHGPYARLPKGLSKGARKERLLLRTIQAEHVARFMLICVLKTPGLWPVFRDPKRIDRFWGLTTRDMRALWPWGFELPTLKNGFDRSALLE